MLYGLSSHRLRLCSCGKLINLSVVLNDCMLTTDSISATDWLEETLPNEPSWRSEDTVRLAGILAEHGVDLLDVSTGGIHPAQKITGGPFAYQAQFAEEVKKAHGDKIFVGAVGAITTGKIAQGILDQVSGQWKGDAP